MCLIQNLLQECLPAKLEGHNFFPLESSFGILPRGIYVSEALKKILQKQKFDNIKFEKAKCSLDGSVIP